MSARRFPRITGFRPRYADVAATLALVFAMGGTAYAVSSLPNGSVSTAAIQNHAVTHPKIATEAVDATNIVPGAVTHGKIAANAITGGDVLNHSLRTADLAGASVTGPISFTLSAHSCGYLTLAVSGAKVGQTAILTWVGTSNPPAGVVTGPLKVVKTGRVVTSACNLTGHKIVGTGVKVRVTTLS